MKRFLFILLLFFFFSAYPQSSRHPNKAYHSHDIGIFLGGSYYIGDLNPAKHFFMTQPALGVFYRFNMNYRVAFRGGFNFGSLLGDDSQTDNPDQLERNLNFKTRVEELYTIAEFNFWEYRIGHTSYTFAPYIFAGLAGFHFNPMANIGNQWVDLQPLSTEGQKTSLSNQKPYKLYQMSIPFGIGFKLNLSNYIGLSFEWGPRKTFTDYLDDVSGKYVDPIKLAKEKGGMAAVLSNRSKNPGDVLNDVGKMRGNPNTKDWYFFYGLTISFKLKQKPKECKGV
jgi:hypothetical protein